MAPGEPVARCAFYLVDSLQFGRCLLINVPGAWGCPFQCIYCSEGGALTATTRRRRYAIENPLDHASGMVRDQPLPPSYLLVSGNADPALNTALGGILPKLGRQTRLPVAVRTTGALLGRESIRRSLDTAAVVIVKLDAVNRRQFNRMHRPHKGIHLTKHIDGLKRFRDGFAGSVLVETVVVAGMNDEILSVGRLFDVLRRLEPDGVILYLHAEGEETALARRVREGGKFVSNDFPVLSIDGRRLRDRIDIASSRGDSTSSVGIPWEAAVHRAQSATLAGSPIAHAHRGTRKPGRQSVETFEGNAE